MKHLIVAALALCLSQPAVAATDFLSSEMVPPPQSEIDKIMADPDCELFEDHPANDAIDSTTLSANVRVHIVPCFAGAYNLMSKVLIERRDDESDTSTFDTLSFADYRSDLGWIGTDMLTNAFINPETGHLAHFYKGRGLGDCGSTGSWKWTGYLFAMVDYYVEEDCNGRTPDQWSAVYINESLQPQQSANNNTQDCSVAPYCEDRRYFKDFLVSCRAPENDGSRFCSANAYVHNTEAPAGFDYQLRVSRERRDAPLRVSMIAVFDFMNRSKPVDISVDGERVAFLSPDEIETYQSINDYFVGPQDTTDRIVEAMRAGKEIQVSYTGESGRRQTVPFSLSGLTASLLWMQENAGN
jgi:uncharacterized protein DUF1176